MKDMNFAKWLTLLFIGLKLCEVIDWNWWWVLSPYIVSVTLTAIVAVYEADRKKNDLGSALNEYANRLGKR